MIIFAVVERRQGRAVDLDQLAAQRFRRAAVVDPFESRDDCFAAFADAEQAPLNAANV